MLIILKDVFSIFKLVMTIASHFLFLTLLWATWVLTFEVDPSSLSCYMITSFVIMYTPFEFFNILDGYVYSRKFEPPFIFIIVKKSVALIKEYIASVRKRATERLQDESD